MTKRRSGPFLPCILNGVLLAILEYLVNLGSKIGEAFVSFSFHGWSLRTVQNPTTRVVRDAFMLQKGGMQRKVKSYGLSLGKRVGWVTAP